MAFSIDRRTNKIHLTKGDSAAIVLDVFCPTIPNEDFNAPISGMSIIMSVKKDVRDEEYAFQSQAFYDEKQHAWCIPIVPNQTKNLTSGIYRYDIEININGAIFTVVEDSTFELGKEVTE